MQKVLAQFVIDSPPVSCLPYGNGHINQTYHVICEDDSWYILQKINTTVFQDVDTLMENIRLVTQHLSTKASSSREVLTLVPTRDGRAFLKTAEGCWRVYVFVRDSICFERAERPQLFYESAVAFGDFMNRLADFDATQLTETIPHFHDTPVRFAALRAAIDADTAGRVSFALPEIEAALNYEPFIHTLTHLLAQGVLPLRVTHNDTKINNVLFDAASQAGLCVIDLDTVMPGLVAYDFGDSIRFGATTAAEDEQDLDRVHFDMELYTAYLKGYLTTCGHSLTGAEKAALPVGAKMMTYECGIRFLTDYLMGDVYFRTAYPEHNLIRARTQLKLVAEMDARWDEMNAALQALL